MMRLPVLFVSIWVLVSAKPELYREKEDFEYSRSSSDDGSKSGYYGAQRGNMGGNYEHAHNMDLPAQHQMSTLVRQVDGELGTGSNTRTGSVFTSGSSRGVYGSGNYDLSNLKGRNFEEGNALGSHSSLSSSSGSASNFGYGHEQASSNSRHISSQSQRQSSSSRYHSGGQSSSGVVIDGQQAESLIGGRQSEYDNVGAKSNFKYNSQSSNLGNSDFEENAYNSNSQSKYISGTPVKVYVRPSGRITIPIAAQTYDVSHYNALHDQNSINSDAEVLGSSGTGAHYNPITKHYESSYKYKKEWEKHDTQTIATPTENPFDRNSEYYDSAHLSQNINNQDHFASNFDSSHHNTAQLNKMNSAYSNGFSSGSKLSSSHQSRYQSGSNAESQNLESALATSGSTVEDSRPKHYQSSYSYHKAWERQGDPYVIEPVSSSSDSDLQTSQRLTAGSQNYGHASSHQHGFHSQSHQSYSSGRNVDCDEHGHIRVARSYNINQKPSTYKDNLEQQSQNEWENVEDLGQQAQDKFTDLGQQTQDKWDNLENLGQQTQDSWDHLENLSQQQQNKWENQEELEQKHHNRWEHLEQHPQRKLDKLEDLGQIVESSNDKQNVQQMPQNSYINSVGHFGQLPQDVWGKADSLGYQKNYVRNDDFEQTQSHFNKYGHNIVHEDQSPWQRLYLNMRNINQQNMENGQVDSCIHSHGKHLHLQNENLFGHGNDERHHSEAGSWTSNTQRNSWNSYAHENRNYKQFSDFWNSENFNENYWQHGLDLDSKQQSSEINHKENNIGNLWDKLEKLDKALHTQGNNVHDYSANSNNFESTETVLITKEDINKNADSQNNDSNTPTPTELKTTHIDEPKQPMDIGRGDIGPEDFKNEIVSADQHKNNDILIPSNNNRTAEKTEYHNLNKNSLNQHTTTEDTLDISVLNLDKNINTQNTHYNSNSTLNEDSTADYKTEVNNHQQHHNIIGSNVEQHSENLGQHIISQQSHDFEQQNMDQQSEVFRQKNKDQPLETHKQNFGQHLEDFSHQNVDQQLETFSQQNTDQQLEDFSHQNTDQQLEDFSQQTQQDQQLENFSQPNTDQQLEQFSQQNTDQQLEDFSQQNTDQQLEQFSQQNADQQLEDFSQQNTDQQLEDFSQQNTDQQLEQFSQQNTDQQLEDFSQQNTDQQLEDFSQQTQQDQQLENFSQPNTDQQLEQFSQQNTDQQLEDFSQQNTDQQLEQFSQQNTDQQLEDFSQQNTDQQLEDFSQQNTDQQLEDFSRKNMDQQLENFSQQNTDQQLEQFSHQNKDPQLEHFSQHNTEQQLEGTDFSQQNIDSQLETFKQQIMSQDMEDFSQKNVEQPLETFEQQSMGQELEDFSQNNMDQKWEDFSQHNMEQQLEHFSQYMDQALHGQGQSQTTGKFKESEQIPQNNDKLQKENMEEDAQVFDKPKDKSHEEVVPKEPVTEKPSFWASVGSKLSKAKDSVTGWFKRS